MRTIKSQTHPLENILVWEKNSAQNATVNVSSATVRDAGNMERKESVNVQTKWKGTMKTQKTMQTKKRKGVKKDAWKNFEVLIALYDIEVALATNTHDLDKARARVIEYVKKHFAPVKSLTNLT